MGMGKYRKLLGPAGVEVHAKEARHQRRDRYVHARHPDQDVHLREFLAHKVHLFDQFVPGAVLQRPV